MALPDSPAARHEAVAGELSRLAGEVTDWSAPSPVPEWSARDVVAHLVAWLPGFLSGGGVALPAGPAVDDDPVAAWEHHAGAVQRLIEERGDEPFTHPQVGTHPLGRAVDQFYTTDVFMHSWDLARAAGLEPRLDEDLAARALAGMAPIEDLLRGSGQYGPAIPVADDAPVVERLMAFVGRDPAWRAP